MPRRCIFSECKNTPKKDNVTLHLWPRRPELAQSWGDFVRCHEKNRNWEELKRKCICSAHFTADSYKHLPTISHPDSYKSHLKPTAVPSLFLPEEQCRPIDDPFSVGRYAVAYVLDRSLDQESRVKVSTAQTTKGPCIQPAERTECVRETGPVKGRLTDKRKRLDKMKLADKKKPPDQRKLIGQRKHIDKWKRTDKRKGHTPLRAGEISAPHKERTGSRQCEVTRLEEREVPLIKVEKDEQVQNESSNMNMSSQSTTPCQPPAPPGLDLSDMASLIKIKIKDKIHQKSNQVTSDKEDKYQCFSSFTPNFASCEMKGTDDKFGVCDRVYIPSSMMEEVRTLHPLTCTQNTACNKPSSQTWHSETVSASGKCDGGTEIGRRIPKCNTSNSTDFCVTKVMDRNNCNDVKKRKSVFGGTNFTVPNSINISVPLPGKQMKTARQVSLITHGGITGDKWIPVLKIVPGSVIRPPTPQLALSGATVSGIPLKIVPESSCMPCIKSTAAPVTALPTAAPVTALPTAAPVTALPTAAPVCTSVRSTVAPVVSSCIVQSVYPDTSPTTGNAASSSLSLGPSQRSTAAPLVPILAAAPVVTIGLGPCQRPTAAPVVCTPTAVPFMSTTISSSDMSTAAPVLSSPLLSSLPNFSPSLWTTATSDVSMQTDDPVCLTAASSDVSMPTTSPVCLTTATSVVSRPATMSLCLTTAASTSATSVVSRPATMSLCLTTAASTPATSVVSRPATMSLCLTTAASTPATSVPVAAPVVSMLTAEHSLSNPVLQSILSPAGPVVHDPVLASHSSAFKSHSIEVDHRDTALSCTSVSESISLLPSQAPSSSGNSTAPEVPIGTVGSDPIVIDMKALTKTGAKERPGVSMIYPGSVMTRSHPVVVTSTHEILTFPATPNVSTQRTHSIPAADGIPKLTPDEMREQHPQIVKQLSEPVVSEDNNSSLRAGIPEVSSTVTMVTNCNDMIQGTAPLKDPDSHTSQATIKLNHDPLDLNNAKDYLEQIGLYPLPSDKKLTRLQPLTNYQLTNKLVMALSWTYTDPGLQRQIVKRLSLEEPNNIHDPVLSTLMKNMWKKGRMLRKGDTLEYEKFLDEPFWYEPNPPSASKHWVIKCNQISQTQTVSNCKTLKKTKSREKTYIAFLEKERQCDLVTLQSLSEEVKRLKKKNQKYFRTMKYQAKQIAKFKRKNGCLRNRLLQLRQSTGKKCVADVKGYNITRI